MRGLHRVCRPDAELDIIVPHFSNPYYYSDPTHERFFGMYTMFYFSDHDRRLPRSVPSFYTDVRFAVESITLRIYYRPLVERITNKLMRRLVNRSYRTMDWYERRMCWLYHAHEIRYRIRCVK